MARITVKSVTAHADLLRAKLLLANLALACARETVADKQREIDTLYVAQRPSRRAPGCAVALDDYVEFPHGEFPGETTQRRLVPSNGYPRYTDRTGQVFEKRTVYHGNRVVTRHVPVAA